MANSDEAKEHDAQPGTIDKSRRRNRILIIFGVTICALVLGVLFLPKPVARYVIADQLEQMGITHKGVDTLKIDLWNQLVELGPVEFNKSNDTPGQIGNFSLKLRLANLLNRRAIIDHVIIGGVDLKIHRTKAGAISINGIAVRDILAKRGDVADTTPSGDGASTAQSKDPWHAALEKLQLRDSRILLDQEGRGRLTVKVGRLDLNGFRTWEPENPGTFNLEATVNGVRFKWLGEARPFADKITLAIDATVNDVEIAKIENYVGSFGFERRGGVLSSRFNHMVSLQSNGRIDWTAKGKFEISNADIALADQGGIGFDSANVDVNAKASVRAGNEVDLTSKIDVVMRNIRSAPKDGQSIGIEGLRLELADLSAQVLGDGTVHATVKPRLVMDGAKLDGPASVQVGVLTADMSKFDLKLAANALSLSAAGKASLTRATAAMPPTDRGPAADITIGSINVPIDSLSFSLTENVSHWQAAFSMALSDLATQLAKGKAADLRLGRLSAEGVQIDQLLNIEMKTLLLGGLNTRLSDKILPAPEIRRDDAVVKETNKVVTHNAAPATTSPVGITIGRVALLDRGKIQFVDGSVSPSVEFKLAVDRLEIENLDTSNVDQRSDLKFQAKINEFSDVGLSGWATLFRSDPDFDLNLKLKGLELPRFSPYVTKLIGMHMESGQLNLEAKAAGKKAALDGKLDVNLRNLELGDLSPENAKKIADQVGMPIQTAIGLLQDSDKVINLKLPVKGTISEPEVDVSDAVQKAVGGALTSLFPPTAIASMLISASKGGATFAPVPFKTGTATLDAAGISMAKNLAQLLSKRPKLSLRVCGRATLGDVEHYKAFIMAQQNSVQTRQEMNSLQLDAAKKPVVDKEENGPKTVPLTAEEILRMAKTPMTKLALDRTRSVRNFLLLQNKALNGRVSECRSSYNPKDKDTPRVNVSL